MGGFSEDEALAILKHITGIEPLASPTHIYLSLLTAIPTASSKGTTVTEVTAPGYAKLQIPISGLEPIKGATCAVKLIEEILFSAITSGGSANVVGWCVTDNPEPLKGNLICWGTCPSTEISEHRRPAIAPNVLELTLK